jgi:anti-anti-sigma factor
MEITRREENRHTVLALKGRLDGYWASHFSKSLEEALHGGARRIRVDLSELSYISSLGIRVLVDYYKKLIAIQGSFGVTDASERVRSVLSMAGLMDLLTAADGVEARAEETVVLINRPAAVYEVLRGAPGASMTCQAVGHPELLGNGGFRAAHCRPMLLPDPCLAVGLGAFGNGFEDCQNRFGEFLAAGGAATYQPTDGGNVADYLLATEALVPEVQVLYGLVCHGSFAHVAQFGAKQEHGSIQLAELIADCLSIARTDRAAIVLVAESAGLLGASLRKPPVEQRAARFASGCPSRRSEFTCARRPWSSESSDRRKARSSHFSGRWAICMLIFTRRHFPIARSSTAAWI